MIPVLVAILCITLQVPETAHAQQIQSFCGPTSPTCPPPSFTWLDIPVDTATYRSNQYVIAGGWAFQCMRPIQHYAIELDGVFIGRHASGPVPTPAPAIFAGYRPDVAGYFNAVLPDCLVSDWSGFSFWFAPGELPVGSHTIRVWVLTPRWNDLPATWQPTQKVTVHVLP